MKNEKIYTVTVSYDTTYDIEARSQEEAKNCALEWFSECMPNIQIVAVRED